MISIEQQWDISLLDLKYGNGYDIRIHAVQVALCLLSRRSQLSQLKDLDLSLVRFGYYDVETENAVGRFQQSVTIPKSNKLDKLTYEYLFDSVRTELNSIIVQVGRDKLQIQEITSDMLEDEYDSNSDSAINNSSDADNWYNPSFGDIDEFNQLIDNYYSNEDEERGGLIIGATNNSFFDKFWGSMLDDYDSVFLSTTNNTKSFGDGGRLNLSGGSSDTGGGSFSNSNNDTNNFGSSYIDSLLSNSIYSGNYDYVKPSSWISNSSMNINVDGYSYEKSEKHKTFFSPKNSSTTRKSNYDITIVYGANGQFAKKLLGVVHRSRSQQVDSSGEAIFDIVEFIAKDIVETNNTRK